MALFRQELAIDLGTANTVIFKDGDVVLDEPSIIATDTKSGKLMALGNHAQLMEEHTPPGITTIRPLMNGVIADYDAAEMMLTGFIKKATGDKKRIINKLKPDKEQKVFFSYLEYNDLQPLNEKAKTIAYEDADSVLAFCGIANPNPFVEELKKHYKTVDFLQFADHHAYTKEDLTAILKCFECIEGKKKIIVTTEKDAARLTNSPYLCQFEIAPLYDLPVSVRFHEEEKFNKEILNYVRKNSHDRWLH